MKADRVGLMGSVLTRTGILVAAEADESCWSGLVGLVPCKREADEPQLTGIIDGEVVKGDCAGNVGGVELELATDGDGRPGKIASPGVEERCVLGVADGV